MSDLFGNHIVGFPTRRLIYFFSLVIGKLCSMFHKQLGRIQACAVVQLLYRDKQTVCRVAARG